MIIDLILDRKDGQKYNPKIFYTSVMQYGEIGWNIAEALDNGNEKTIKEAISKYITDNEYNPKIIDYIKSVKWL